MALNRDQKRVLLASSVSYIVVILDTSDRKCCSQEHIDVTEY
jgi:hypothetical protein